MSINEVIKLGKEAEDYIYVDFYNHPTWVWILAGVICLLTVVRIVLGIWKGIDLFSSLKYLLIIVFMFSFAFTTDISWHGEVTKWKEDVATPYIESLPVEKKEVVFIKIDPELSERTSGNMFYTYSTEVEKTPVTISFKDNGKVITKTNWIETDMELDDTDKPYVEFQRLEKDLGHDMDAGLYNLKVHLPNDYEFTEIK